MPLSLVIEIVDISLDAPSIEIESPAVATLTRSTVSRDVKLDGSFSNHCKLQQYHAAPSVATALRRC